MPTLASHLSVFTQNYFNYASWLRSARICLYQNIYMYNKVSSLAAVWPSAWIQNTECIKSFVYRPR